jgi:hypothetical protein
MIPETIQNRTPAGVGKTLQSRHERFDFERCCADEENAQSYFLGFGLRMLTPPWLRNGRGVIISSIS